jgi:hypothetical protein
MPPVSQDILVTLSAGITLQGPGSVFSFGIGIGDGSTALSPFGFGAFRAWGAYSVSGQTSVRWSGWPGNVINSELHQFNGNITVGFRRLSGSWFVEHGSLPQTPISLSFNSNALWHGIGGTNGVKTYLQYSYSLIEI